LKNSFLDGFIWFGFLLLSEKRFDTIGENEFAFQLIRLKRSSSFKTDVIDAFFSQI
jgi:hypothetical protein